MNFRRSPLKAPSMDIGRHIKGISPKAQLRAEWLKVASKRYSPPLNPLASRMNVLSMAALRFDAREAPAESRFER